MGSIKFYRWQKCVEVASSDNSGFGMAAGHAYIKEKFDNESRAVVSIWKYVWSTKPNIAHLRL